MRPDWSGTALIQLVALGAQPLDNYTLSSAAAMA